MAYPFEPTMLSSPGAGSEGWRHDGFSQVAAGVRAPVPGRGGLRRVAAGAPLGIGLRLPGVRARRVLAARAQGPDPAMPGLPARDLGDGGHGHAPQPPAAEGLVHRRLAGGDAQERDVGPAAVAPARAGQLQVGLAAAAQAARGGGGLVRRRRGAGVVAGAREPLAGLVEVDETSLPFRAKDAPVGPRPGRSHEGKLLIAGAVEIRGKGPGRTRLAVIGDYSAASLGGFVAGNVAEGGTVVSDGWSGYARLKDVKHDPKVVGDAPAHLVLPWIHRVFANAKRWALGVYHGLREEHLQAYLDEFLFRFNRRRTPQAAFGRLLGLAVTTGPHPYDALVASGSKG